MMKHELEKMGQKEIDHWMHYLVVVVLLMMIDY